jgi:5-hydroxyisourate hydrolase
MITTHVLDTAAGKPARGIAVELDRLDGPTWQRVGAGTTDDDGRLRTLTPPGPVAPGTYRIRFATASHSTFFPVVEVCFAVAPADVDQHYHVPLLLSPFGYSTYRGS